ncbi:MAG: hypothetical protein ACON3Z_04600 [Bradymonadia bacterium]
MDRSRLIFRAWIAACLCLAGSLLGCGEPPKNRTAQGVQAPRTQLGVVSGPAASNGDYQLRGQGVVMESHDGRFGMRLGVEPISQMSGNDEFRLEGGLIP